ncbi:MAG TPA: CapA family protein [Candidatus Saccharimonadales bacterium]|nr:CapA family protein [Candidatus Saccharimonadales bacterium]
MNHRAGAVRRRGHRTLIVALIFAGAAAVVWAGQSPLRQSKPSQASPVRTSEGTSRVTDVTIESDLLFVGDIYWGRAINKRAQASSLKEAYPFARLSEFGRERYDAWIGNLECPSVPGVVQPYTLEVQKLLFNCPSSYLPEFAKWFTGVSLANNHTGNQGGQRGLDATRQALEAQGIQYFGHYDSTILRDVCEVLSLPATLTKARDAGQAAEIPVAFCGYHGLSVQPPAGAIDQIREYAKYMPVIAIVHMGSEYTAKVDTVRQGLYRSMIDNGAQAVIGGHPHWVQPAETYKGRLIAYSLGNFMFDQRPGETSRGAAISMAIQTRVNALEASKLTYLAKSCRTFRDTCLARAKRLSLKRPSFVFAYQAQGVDLSGYQTHPADDALDQLVLDRLNWQSVGAGLRR